MCEQSERGMDDLQEESEVLDREVHCEKFKGALLSFSRGHLPGIGCQVLSRMAPTTKSEASVMRETGASEDRSEALASASLVALKATMAESFR